MFFYMIFWVVMMVVETAWGAEKSCTDKWEAWDEYGVIRDSRGERLADYPYCPRPVKEKKCHLEFMRFKIDKDKITKAPIGWALMKGGSYYVWLKRQVCKED